MIQIVDRNIYKQIIIAAVTHVGAAQDTLRSESILLMLFLFMSVIKRKVRIK
jgi:hypothetical protein